MTSPPAFSLRLPRIMGHRGAKALAPENTLCSMKAAAGAGARWVEFDVLLTADGEPVPFHDDPLQRTPDVAGEMPTNPFTEVQGPDATPRFDRQSGIPRALALAGPP